MTKTPAGEVAGSITPGPTKFYVRKRNVRPMLHALTGTQPNPFQPNGALGLQDRSDISGKFSRRLGGIRRALTRADQDIIDERKELTLRHAAKFPETEADGSPHPKAGQFTPVYQETPDGKPVFKKDHAGNDTEERIVIPDQYNVVDLPAFEKEFKALLDEFIVVECVGFTEDDFNAFKSVTPKLIDPLIDLLRGGPTEATPEEQAKALEAMAESYKREAERIRKHDGAPLAPEPEEQEPDKKTDGAVVEDRSAP